MSFPNTTISPANGNNLIIAASIEISPKHALEMDQLKSMIPARTRVYIADVGTHDEGDMTRACQRLGDLNLVAVPHIAARRLINRIDLETRIKRYAQAGVSDVLVVAGNPGSALGEFDSAMQVLATGILDANGINDIAIAGHPEGSPDFSDEVALAALRLKWQFAQRSDANLRIVTQFGFDPAVFINWAEGLRDHGIDLPIHLGVAGPAKITTLLKYAALCGVGNSISFLKKRASILTALLTSHSPEAMVGPIETHIRNTENSAIQGIHAFPFGGVEKTAQWLCQRGSWQNPSPRFEIANEA